MGNQPVIDDGAAAAAHEILFPDGKPLEGYSLDDIMEVAAIIRKHCALRAKSAQAEQIAQQIAAICNYWHHDNPKRNEQILDILRPYFPTWFKVEEQLPTVTGVYSVYPPEQVDADQGLPCSARYFMANEDRNTYVGRKLAYGWVKNPSHTVTHWQPLPVPPKDIVVTKDNPNG